MLFDYLGNEIGLPIVNVKEFGARGTSSGDDSDAIQEAIDSVRQLGGVVYFPAGIYPLAKHILFYSKQLLFFEPGATLRQAAGIDNLLMSYCADATEGYDGTHDCIIYGATFDGATTYSTNNTLVGIVHAKNIIFEKCVFKNAYGTWHNLEINSSYNVKVINCDFEGSRKTGANGELIQIDSIGNEATWPWPSNRGAIDGTVCRYIEIYGCQFHDDTLVPAIGNHSSVVNRYINIHDNIFDGITSTRGTIILSNTTNVDVHDNVFTGCTTGVASSETSHFIHDNIFVNVTTAASGSASAVHNNMINGTYTA